MSEHFVKYRKNKKCPGQLKCVGPMEQLTQTVKEGGHSRFVVNGLTQIDDLGQE
jgi:hypothetical protein